MPYRIERDAKKKKYEIFSNSDQPLVYHDTNLTWQLATRDKGEQDRFFDAFYASGGTLCLSLSSIAEMLQRTKGAWFEPFCDYLDKIGDRFLFLNSDFSKVLRKENRYPRGSLDPALDQKLIKKSFMHFYLKDKTEPNLRQVFEYLYEDEEQKKDILEHYEMLTRVYTQKMEEVRVEYEEEGGKERVRRAIRDAMLRPHYTSFMFRTAMFEIAKDKSMVVDAHHAHDLLHTVVPVSWCDCVVLDGCWYDIAQRALRKRPHEVHVFKYAQKDEYYKHLREFGMRHRCDAWERKLRMQGRGPFSI